MTGARRRGRPAKAVTEQKDLHEDPRETFSTATKQPPRKSAPERKRRYLTPRRRRVYNGAQKGRDAQKADAVKAYQLWYEMDKEFRQGGYISCKRSAEKIWAKLASDNVNRRKVDTIRRVLAKMRKEETVIFGRIDLGASNAIRM